MEPIHCAQRTLRRLFVLEVCENIAAGGAMLLDAGDHRLALFRSIGRFAVAIVRIVGGDYVGRVALFRFGYTKRDVALAQSVPCGGDAPRFVAELKCPADTSGQAFP